MTAKQIDFASKFAATQINGALSIAAQDYGRDAFNDPSFHYSRIRDLADNGSKDAVVQKKLYDSFFKNGFDSITQAV